MRVQSSLNDRMLAAYVTGQLQHMFNDGHVVAADDVLGLLPEALRRVEHCFTRIRNKYFFDGKSATFDHLNGDQYAMFLYLLSNTAYKAGAPRSLSAKLYLLNKTLHGLDAFYEVELPSIFMFVHPLGTVLGRAVYSDYLVVYQRCGIGSNHDVYPRLGEFLTLRPGSSVLGRSSIGRNCTIAAESLVIDRDVPDNTIYIGNPRAFVCRTDDTRLGLWHEPN